MKINSYRFYFILIIHLKILFKYKINLLVEILLYCLIEKMNTEINGILS